LLLDRPANGAGWSAPPTDPPHRPHEARFEGRPTPYGDLTRMIHG
jgi:hypothetical protein